MQCIILYESETWPLREDFVIRLGRMNAKAVTGIFNIKVDNSISLREHENRLQWNIMR